VVEIKLNVVELKLDCLIDEMRFLKLHTIAFDTACVGSRRILAEQTTGPSIEEDMALATRDLPTSKPRVEQSPYKFSFEIYRRSIVRSRPSELADATMGSTRPHSASIQKSNTERYRRRRLEISSFLIEGLIEALRLGTVQACVAT
jgi:hypothetical protein